MIHLLFFSVILALTQAQAPIHGQYAIPAVQQQSAGFGLHQIQTPQNQYALPGIQSMEIPTLPPMTFPALPPAQPPVSLNICGLPACGLGGATAPAYYLASDGNYYVQPAAATAVASSPAGAGATGAAGAGAAGSAGAAAAAEETTTKGPPNRFNEAGWETDDNGNVYVGDDNAKLYLISVGSYWPFPKDYRKKREISGPAIEYLLGFHKL